MSNITVSNSRWAKYKSCIADFMDTAGQTPVIWRRFNFGLDRYQEDNDNSSFTDTPIVGLFQYNYFRSWPLNKDEEGGELDKESTVLLLDMRFLRDNGFLNANDNFDYNEDADRFIIDGIVWKSFGYTKIASAQNEGLIFQIILKRDPVETGGRNV